MLYKLLFFLILISWYIFSGYNNLFYLTSGLICSIITSYIVIKMRLINYKESKFCLKLNHVSYIFWLIKEIIKSSIEVSLIIWQKKPNISPISGWVDCPFPSEIKQTIYANSVTLTPGTVCVDVHGDKILVHSLLKKNFETLDNSEMFKRIKEL
ncbi:MAG: Na+/H+ antiporter subunit E [Alphaproteobacteria bacterium]